MWLCDRIHSFYLYLISLIKQDYIPVGCVPYIPAWSAGVCSRGCLLLGVGGVCSGGVCSWGVSAPRGLSAKGGVSAPGGVCSGGVCSRGCLPPGMSALGVSASGGVSAPRGWGCLLPGGVCSGCVCSVGCLLWGCLLWGGCLLQKGVCSGGCLLQGEGVSAPGGCVYPSMHWGRHPPPPLTESQMPVKT